MKKEVTAVTAEPTVVMQTWAARALQMVDGKKVWSKAAGIARVDMPGWIRSKLEASPKGMMLWLTEEKEGAVEAKTWVSLSKDAPLGYTRMTYSGIHRWEEGAVPLPTVTIPKIAPVLAMAKAEVVMPAMCETLVEKTISEMTLADFLAYYASEQSDVRSLSWTVMVPNPQAAVVVAPAPTPTPKTDKFAVVPAPKKVRGKKANGGHGEVKVAIPVEDGNAA